MTDKNFLVTGLPSETPDPHWPHKVEVLEPPLQSRQCETFRVVAYPFPVLQKCWVCLCLVKFLTSVYLEIFIHRETKW